MKGGIPTFSCLRLKMSKNFIIYNITSIVLNWLFLFNNRQNVSESFLASHLSEYFKSYYKIGLDSGIYILIYSENNSFLFEVYRKMPNSNITVSLLCKLNQISNNVEKIFGKNVLVRQRDLTEVTLRLVI